MAGTVVPMETRVALLTAGALPGANVSELCRQTGVSRKSYYQFKAAFEAGGLDGLAPKSRRPHRSPKQTSPELEDEIVRLRKTRAVDNGAQAIAYELARTGWTVPAVSTVHRTLVRRGLVTAQPQKRPHTATCRFEFPAPNACWQIDATRWELARGPAAWIMDVLDDHSRLVPAAVVGSAPTIELAWAAISTAATSYGLPAQVLSDNGSCFTGRGERLCDFERDLAALGVRTSHSRPYHPQTCGKIERFHQTLKRWLTTQPLAASYSALHAQLDTYLTYYNHDRPHRALHGATPIERWAASPADGPTVPFTLDEPTRLVITSNTVNANGVLSIGHRDRVHVGVAWAGHKLTVAHYGNRVLIADGTQHVRDITLDPNQHYYPSGRPAGGRHQPRLRSRS
jgi:transposase InsO family protein